MTIVKFVQDFVMPLELRLLLLRADDGGKLIAAYYHDYWKIFRKKPSANGTGARSWTWSGAWRTEVRCQSLSRGKWQPPRCFYTQPLAKQDHRWRHAVLQDVQQTCRPVLSVDYWGLSRWVPSRTSHPISTPPTVTEEATLSSSASATLKARSTSRNIYVLSGGGHPLSHKHSKCSSVNNS